MAYVECADYDSMGNQNRFPKKNKLHMKRLNFKKYEKYNYNCYSV